MDKEVGFFGYQSLFVDYQFFHRCGPLVHAWCMRYEAKNKCFKKTALVIGNFKNIVKTVATRHQRSMCQKMIDTDSFLGRGTAYGVGMIATFVLANKIVFFLSIVKPMKVDELECGSLLMEERSNLTTTSEIHK